jgi:transcription antitermination factor NusB
MTNSKNLDKHLSRILSISFLYTYYKSQDTNVDLGFFEPNSVLDILEEKKYDTRLYEQLTEGAMEYQDSIDKVIKELAPEWNLVDMNLLNLIILRISIYEAFIGELTPVAIVINEAMELKKELGSEEGAGFINGVLGAIAKDDQMKALLKKETKENE